MILVDYRGKPGPRILYLHDSEHGEGRKELRECIEWLERQLIRLDEQGIDWDSIFDLTDLRTPEEKDEL